MVSKTASFLSEQVSLVGNLKLEASIRIDGKVRGSIVSTHDVTIGKTSEIDADIISRNIISSGKITGKQLQAKSITLDKKGSIVGNIKASSLKIEGGGVLYGIFELIPDNEL